jgi:hypothetical protein
MDECNLKILGNGYAKTVDIDASSLLLEPQTEESASYLTGRESGVSMRAQ